MYISPRKSGKNAFPRSISFTIYTCTCTPSIARTLILDNKFILGIPLTCDSPRLSYSFKESSSEVRTVLD